MRIQTFHTNSDLDLLNTSTFVSEYEDNIRSTTIPPRRLPIFINDYFVESLDNVIRIQYSSIALEPTNTFSKSIWNMHFGGTIKKDTVSNTFSLKFYGNEDDLYPIDFEGMLSGQFIVRSDDNIYNASEYWSYTYNSNLKEFQLQFDNTTSPINLTSDRTFELHIYVENVILTSCRSGSEPYPPDNIKNTYCVHNSDATGAFGNFEVSGDVSYTDFNQNYRIIPSFQGSRRKLVLTLVQDPNDNVGAFFGPIFAITYVGGPMYENAYITFENKTNSRVCVWIDPTVDPKQQPGNTHTFVDPGRNTVAILNALTEGFRYHNGQYDPCFQ
jgi:hypothetical protein